MKPMTAVRRILFGVSNFRAMAVVSMVALAFSSSGCSKFLYTQDEWRVMERDMEAVEEELDDIQKDSVRKREELAKYVSQIDDMERERHLYDRTMARVREAFMQDIGATAGRMESLARQMDDIYARSDSRSRTIKERLADFESDWVKRFSMLLKSYCAHWKCSDDGRIDEKTK